MVLKNFCGNFLTSLIVPNTKMFQLITVLTAFSLIYGSHTWYLSVIEELIIGGEPTKVQDVPYQAAFFYYDYYFCAGCIISSSHILTAAHCLALLPMNLEGLSVRVGSTKMYSGGQITQVKKIILHPKFSITNIDYDVAVVELKSFLKFTNVVQPLKIGEKEPGQGEEVRVSGWGFIKETGPPSRKLRSVIVKVVGRKECKKNYKNVLVITKRMVCASGEGKDACYGDSGGPLVFKNRLVGIVSSGEGCARKDFPGIYTNVANSEIANFIRKRAKL